MRATTTLVAFATADDHLRMLNEASDTLPVLPAVT